MFAIASEREQHQPAGTTVDQLSAETRGDSDELADAQSRRFAFDEEVKLPFHDEVDLLLALVAVNPPPLPRLEHDLVHPKRRDAQLTAERDEAISAVGIQPGPRHALFHG
jgi:hypothetical protein